MQIDRGEMKLFLCAVLALVVLMWAGCIVLDADPVLGTAGTLLVMLVIAITASLGEEGE